MNTDMSCERNGISFYTFPIHCTQGTINGDNHFLQRVWLQMHISSYKKCGLNLRVRSNQDMSNFYILFWQHEHRHVFFKKWHQNE